MRADWDELRHWYVCSLVGCLLPAGGWVVVGRWRSRRSLAATPAQRHLRDVSQMGIALIAFGIVATPLASRWTGQFALTWPAAIYGALQTALAHSLELRRDPANRSIRLRSRAAGAVLLAVCAVYFVLLRDQSLPHEWVFLICALVGAPVTVAVVALARLRPQAPLVLVGATWAGFTAYFWLAPLLPFVRDAIVGPA